MTFEDYKQLISKVSLGKRLPDAIYLHKSVLNNALPCDLLEFVNTQIRHYNLEEQNWNVLKLSRLALSFSFLNYQNCLEDPYTNIKLKVKKDILFAL